MCSPAGNFEEPWEAPSQCPQEAWYSASSQAQYIRIPPWDLGSCFYSLFSPHLASPRCSKLSPSPGWWGSRPCTLERDRPGFGDALCSTERLPGRSQKVLSSSGLSSPSTAQSLCDSETLTGMGRLCIFTVLCSPPSPSLEAGFCPELERRAAGRRCSILPPHLWCPGIS